MTYSVRIPYSVSHTPMDGAAGVVSVTANDPMPPGLSGLQVRSPAVRRCNLIQPARGLAVLRGLREVCHGAFLPR